MAFVIVKFSSATNGKSIEEVEAVPQSWVRKSADGTSVVNCYWPHFRGEQLMKAIKNANAPHNTCKMYPAKILGTYGKFYLK